MKRLAACLMLLALSGCRGTYPELYGDPIMGIASVLLDGRVILPTGETRNAKLYVNFETERGGRDSERYRLKVLPRDPRLYQVEPGTYRLTPTRSVFGFHQANLKIRIDGRTYKVPFPRDILRKAAITVRPTKIVPLGIFEVRILSKVPGRPATLQVRLDDSVAARRQITQEVVRSMMDPNARISARASAVNWTRALDQTLSELHKEIERATPYKPGP